jgi:hypothetical protein
MAKRTDDAFDIDLKDKTQLVGQWCQDIEDAFTMRESMVGDGGQIDLNNTYYEQGSLGPRPYPGAADLTSYLITVNVDAMRARMLQTVMKSEPFCIVDGWGDAAKNAPFVESFHEWKVREEGLEGELAKVIHGGLLEDCFILEVRPRIETRRITEETDVALQTNEQGGVIFGTDGKPLIHMDGEDPRPAQENQPSARVKRTYTKTKSLGPEYDPISMKDFVYLPGHAKNQRAVYGYAYRCWKRVPQLQEDAADGIYDEDAVNSLGTSSDRETDTVPASVDGVAAQYEAAVEKELFQLSINADLDEDGREEWYLATLHLPTRTLLRLKLDTFVMKVGRPRCVPFVFYPRHDSVYGYSFVSKFFTLAEEHTTIRNVIADKSAMSANAPLTVLQSSAWNPDTQPFGVGRSITVRDHNEIKQMVVSDVNQSLIYQQQDVLQANERLSGLSDVAAVGSGNRQSKTLGQDQLVASASAVRVEEAIGHLRSAIEHVMELRHAIWLEALDADPKGLDAPQDVVNRLQVSGNDLEGGKFTKSLLQGRFRFKPYGSVDTADNGMRMQYFNQGFQTLGNILQMFPGAQAIVNDPDVVGRIIEEWGRAYKIRDIGVFQKALQKALQMGTALPQAGGMTPGDPMHAPPPGAAPGPPQGAPPDVLQMLQQLTGGATNGPH